MSKVCEHAQFSPLHYAKADEIYNLLCRKGCDWDEVRSVHIDASQVASIFEVSIDSLKDNAIPFEFLYGEEYDMLSNVTPCTDFEIDMPQWFTMKIGNEYFIIDNEGHNYARYAGLIVF